MQAPLWRKPQLCRVVSMQHACGRTAPLAASAAPAQLRCCHRARRRNTRSSASGPRGWQSGTGPSPQAGRTGSSLQHVGQRLRCALPLHAADARCSVAQRAHLAVRTPVHPLPGVATPCVCLTGVTRGCTPTAGDPLRAVRAMPLTPFGHKTGVARSASCYLNRCNSSKGMETGLCSWDRACIVYEFQRSHPSPAPCLAGNSRAHSGKILTTVTSLGQLQLHAADRCGRQKLIEAAVRRTGRLASRGGVHGQALSHVPSIEIVDRRVG